MDIERKDHVVPPPRIGRKAMKTPPSEPGMYGEQCTELRPGVYFWYVEG